MLPRKEFYAGEEPGSLSGERHIGTGRSALGGDDSLVATERPAFKGGLE